MKRWIALLLCLVMALVLTACGAKTEAAPEATATPAAAEAPAATPEPTAEPAPEEDVSGTNAAGAEDATATDAEVPAGLPEEEEAGPVLDEEKLAAARACIGRPVEDLYAAVGEPTGGTQYATSCVEDYDEDGTLLYDGFYVWTNRSADGEIVRDVNPL